MHGQDTAPTIVVEDPSLADGFTAVPNALWARADVTPGAKLAYIVLLRYAWQDGSCFPGQQRMARDMGATERSVRTYLRELEGRGLVSIRRRGLTQTNVYTLHRLGPENIAGQDRKPPPGPENVSAQERKRATVPERKNLPTTKTQGTTPPTNEGSPVSLEERARRFEQADAEYRRLKRTPRIS